MFGPLPGDAVQTATSPRAVVAAWPTVVQESPVRTVRTGAGRGSRAAVDVFAGSVAAAVGASSGSGSAGRASDDGAPGDGLVVRSMVGLGRGFVSRTAGMPCGGPLSDATCPRSVRPGTSAVTAPSPVASRTPSAAVPSRVAVRRTAEAGSTIPVLAGACPGRHTRPSLLALIPSASAAR